jgi:endonuclease/exonuclease/phosphatase family metal-dependent hydrolase
VNDRRGRVLMAKVRENGLRVLNGRSQSDRSGEYTFEARGSRSTLDYVIVDCLADADLSVNLDFTVASDHALLLT